MQCRNHTETQREAPQRGNKAVSLLLGLYTMRIPSNGCIPWKLECDGVGGCRIRKMLIMNVMKRRGTPCTLFPLAHQKLYVATRRTTPVC